jgi:hypothetical protein
LARLHERIGISETANQASIVTERRERAVAETG